MISRHRLVALLLWGSGFCGLVYQVGWFRQFRLIFGGSTAASSAVLAIFIGGIGIGGLLLGKRADSAKNPLLLYAALEGGIAISAMASPFLLDLVRAIYLHLGGSVVLGSAGGLVMRLVLTAIVLGPPTLLMGGTLPAAARATESTDDKRRVGVAVLYGINAMGAVAGTLVTTFFSLEVLGTRNTLIAAALVNLVIAIAARALSRQVQPREAAAASAIDHPHSAPTWFVLAASLVVGFAFFLMETVWYRMLGPLLGGSIYTLGLILAFALAGIGIGGVAYALWGKEKGSSLSLFASTCILEALLLIIPFALGDDVAIFEAFTRPLVAIGFSGLVLSWSLVAAFVVLPPALLAGYQFPALIGLLGEGDEQVGRHVGLAYAWNTAGAMIGALAGGFVLIPHLSATGCWRLVGLLLTALAVVALVLDLRRARFGLGLAVRVGLAALTVVLSLAAGPTAAWRHSPIGAGRVNPAVMQTPNELEAWRREVQGSVVWAKDGIESSVALIDRSGYGFIVNGKSDGHALIDAPTQVMGGLIGATLHPDPKSALVIGLGTGSTAGWLGGVPSIANVDVVEFEPVILDVARACTPVNNDVLHDPKVHIIMGDAREVVQVSPKKYDIIFSEPSNPYRAGIASLYTKEFYQSASKRLTQDGIFIQWVQGYEIDAATIHTIIATLDSAFPNVEIYSGAPNDLFFVATAAPITYDAGRLRKTLSEPAFAKPMADAWKVEGLEGFLSHYVANAQFTRMMGADSADDVNTDDSNAVEFGLAQSVGRSSLNSMEGALARLALDRHEARPAAAGVDWEVVDELRRARWLATKINLPRSGGVPDARARLVARAEFQKGTYSAALRTWRSQPGGAMSPDDREMLAELAVLTHDSRAAQLIAALGPDHQGEQDILTARLGPPQQACATLAAGFRQYRDHPWLSQRQLVEAFYLAAKLARADHACGRTLFEALRERFAVRDLEHERRTTLVALAKLSGFRELCLEAVHQLGTPVPWDLDDLRFRRDCFAVHQAPELDFAERELEQFEEHQVQSFEPYLAGAREASEPAAAPPGPENLGGATVAAPDAGSR